MCSICLMWIAGILLGIKLKLDGKMWRKYVDGTQNNLWYGSYHFSAVTLLKFFICCAKYFIIKANCAPLGNRQFTHFRSHKHIVAMPLRSTHIIAHPLDERGARHCCYWSLLIYYFITFVSTCYTCFSTRPASGLYLSSIKNSTYFNSFSKRYAWVESDLFLMFFEKPCNFQCARSFLVFNLSLVYRKSQKKSHSFC